ncbi:t-complex protein 1 subunit eta [Quercus suber]|uniref:T-complex protein 1 subunit eta n=1 Tax=Quercus suber TaxID=58331 RepID=A0AAW0JP61_QUESU
MALSFSLPLFFIAHISLGSSQINAINKATEAACLILSVDETVKNPKVYGSCHIRLSLGGYALVKVDVCAL